MNSDSKLKPEESPSKLNSGGQDDKNAELIQFCTELFRTWLEDYRLFVERAMDRDFSHHLYILNEGMEKNIKDQCLPIDYFIERLLQIGLVRNFTRVKDILAMMLKFDNPGF